MGEWLSGAFLASLVKSLKLDKRLKRERERRVICFDS